MQTIVENDINTNDKNSGATENQNKWKWNILQQDFFQYCHIPILKSGELSKVIK